MIARCSNCFSREPLHRDGQNIDFVAFKCRECGTCNEASLIRMMQKEVKMCNDEDDRSKGRTEEITE